MMNGLYNVNIVNPKSIVW